MHMRASSAVCFALLIGGTLALPAIGDDDPLPITKKDLNQSKNNLKKMTLAFLDFESETGFFPPGDILDKNGRPLLSWRVAILKYVEEEELYKQFKLDEPWDSDNNKKLIEKMPKLYVPVRVKAKPGETFYQVFE